MTVARAPRRGESGYEILPGEVYRTPAWVTEHLLAHVAFGGMIWEPAAGEGDMAAALRRKGLQVITSDTRDTGTDFDGLDFLSAAAAKVAEIGRRSGVRGIVTNPPFSRAQEFIERALMLMEPVAGKVAMLLGHDFDTALVTRGHLFNHPAYVGALRLGRRISWLGLDQKASPRQLHDWFIWSWGSEAARRIVIYP